jgi:tetratricopeptide (TPR) repeat protein
LSREPNLPRNIFNLANALSDMEDDKADKEAVELLEDAFERNQDFSFKRQANLLRIKHLKRKMRVARAALEAHPNNAQVKAILADLISQINKSELEHHRQCVENYPTDLQAKYDFAVSLLKNKQYDEAIPLFQEAGKDPRNKVSAMGKIGLCFFHKGWLTDAIDIFNQAVEDYEIKDDGIAKELRYNLARAYEQHGDTEKAIEVYRKLAQLDFAYKDVRQRVDSLRKA